MVGVKLEAEIRASASSPYGFLGISMHIAKLPILLAACLSACGGKTPTSRTTAGGEVPAEKGKTYRWTFDDSSSTPEMVPVLGSWEVLAEGTAPSAPKIIRQTKPLLSNDFPRTIVKDLVFTDLTTQVKCRAESGDTDQACGLMFHLKDSENYFLTRANALEGNVRLYRVVKDEREQIASADASIAKGQWHTLRAVARGGEISVFWNGKEVLSKRDATFASGKVGLWTKADSITAFDDFEATAE
jgi:hypothetical protein